MLLASPCYVQREALFPTSSRPFRVFCWPRWDNIHDLTLLFTEYGRALAHRDDATLILFADPRSDCDRPSCEAILRHVCRSIPNPNLHITLLHCTMKQQDIIELNNKITVTAVLPSIMMHGRAKFVEKVDAPLVHGFAELHEVIRSWDALKRGVHLTWRPTPNGLPPESHYPVKQGTSPSGWMAKQLAPKEAKPRRLGIIIPYRDRAAHLALVAPYLKKYLGDTPHDVFVIEQANNKPFNRAKLFNVGFDQIGPAYDYFAFHDVDLFPVRSDYSYVTQPTHLAARVGPGYRLFYETCMGGVTLINREDYIAINGFSNEFWGWGAEDDDLFLRIKASGRTPARRNGLYDALPHSSNALKHPTYSTNIERLNRMRDQKVDQDQDGLSNLKYRLIGASRTEFYYHLRVDI